MKIRTRPLLVMLGKYAIYTYVLNALLFSLVAAKEGNAQDIKSVKDIRMSLAVHERGVIDVFNEIEKGTNLSFAYDPKQINKDILINLSEVEKSLEEHLLEISRQAMVSFRQVNDRISVKVHSSSTFEKQIEVVIEKKLVTGKVFDSSGEALPGATVLEKGTSNGTVTDIDGAFNIEVGSDAILRVSFIGFVDQEIRVGNRSTIEVALEADVTSLDEIVVVGYGSQKKSDLTGSISSVSTDDFQDQPVISLADALQGRASGIQVSSNSGAPGSSVKIRVRGPSSFSLSNDPLYIIDGIAQDQFENVNVNDIQSMDILKDAAATAIYGSRAANGVVVITTKKGSGAPKITYEVFGGPSVLAKKIDLLGAAEYAEIENTRAGREVYSPTFIDSIRRTGGTDFQDEFFQTGRTQNHQLSVSGGEEKISYYVSGNYVDQEGIVINTNYKKYALRSNLEVTPNNYVKFGMNLFGVREENNNNKGNHPIHDVLIWSPTLPVRDADGEYILSDPVGSQGNNPIAEQSERVSDVMENYIGTNLHATISPTNWLEFKYLMGIDYQTIRQGVLYNKYTFSGRGNTSNGVYNTENMTLQNSFITSVKKEFNGHKIDFTAVFEQTSRTKINTETQSIGLSTTSLSYYNLTLGDRTTADGSYRNWALRSYVGRLNYNFKDKYLLSGTARYDGSSKFLGGNKYGFFPSASFAWHAKNESFLQNLNLFDDLKFRASWGQTGNQGVRPYITLALLESDLENSYTYGTGAHVPGATIRIHPSPGLKWETTEQLNLGVDMSFFEGRLNTSVDVYRKRTIDLIQPVPVDSYLGGGDYFDNVGEVENKGLDILTQVTPVDVNDFKWESSFNISFLKNKVLSLGDEPDTPDIRYVGGGYWNGTLSGTEFVIKEGEPIGSFNGYEYLGPWKESEADLAALYGQKPGDSRYLDVNGDTAITSDDLKLLGNGIPDFYWGWNNSFTYKNFNLNLFFTGSHGNELYNLTYALTMTPTGASRTFTHADIRNHYTPENQNTDVPILNSFSNRVRLNSSRWIEDGSFVRLKNITFSYTFRKEQLKNVGSVKLYVSGQNLWTLSKYKGYDPEVSSSNESDSDIVAGFDAGGYPLPKIYTAGLKVTF